MRHPCARILALAFTAGTEADGEVTTPVDIVGGGVGKTWGAVEVVVVGIVGGMKAGVGGGGPDDVIVAEGRRGVGDRLRVGSLTGLGGGGPFSGPRRLVGPEGPEVRRPTASASDSSSKNCSMSLDRGRFSPGLWFGFGTCPRATPWRWRGLVSSCDEGPRA